MVKANKKIRRTVETIVVSKKKNKFIGGLIIFLAVFLILIFLATTAGLAYEYTYRQKIYPGVKIGGFDISGQSPEDTLEKLVAFKDSVDKEGLTFVAEDKQVIVSPIISSPTDPDLNYRILTFDLEKTVTQAYSVGRGNSWNKNALDKLQILISKRNIPLSFELNEEELVHILKENLSELETPAKNASFEIDDQGQIKVIKEVAGEIFNYQKAVEQLKDNLARLENKKISLELTLDQPKVRAQETDAVLKKIEEILATTTPSLTYKNKSWQLTQEQIVDWLEFDKVQGSVILQFNVDKTIKYLEEIALEIDQEPKDAKFKLENGRVVEFQANQDGLELDLDDAYNQLNSYLEDWSNKEIKLSVKVKPARVTIGDINNLGIKELIGEGRSNFAGSPKNRRHNIAIGAKTLNGILIEPGEEFSLLKALGEIDEEHGYLPELVIKGNRTIPEYGGGLCQIGTTSFRVALDAGLPITQRRNHSYRVRYYEPAGTDATIYNPSPDFRFINDTGYHILFTTQIVGDELIFRFYGTSDGRKVEMTKPRIFNVVAPGPTKIIETLDLPVGEKKCTEHAVYGADTEFERTIIFPDGEVKEEVWKSHYVPWTEVCLIGVEELSSPTSTDEIIEE